MGLLLHITTYCSQYLKCAAVHFRYLHVATSNVCATSNQPVRPSYPKLDEGCSEAERQCIEGGPWVNIDLKSRVTDAVLEEAGGGRTDRSARSIRWCLFTPARQDSRRGPGQEQGRLCRARSQSCWREASCRASDRAERRREVLVKVVNELKARGVNDILIAVADGLKSFPKAITPVFRRRWRRPASST
jgi:Transposase, Mutator family